MFDTAWKMQSVNGAPWSTLIIFPCFYSITRLKSFTLRNLSVTSSVQHPPAIMHWQLSIIRITKDVANSDKCYSLGFQTNRSQDLIQMDVAFYSTVRSHTDYRGAPPPGVTNMTSTSNLSFPWRSSYRYWPGWTLLSFSEKPVMIRVSQWD